MDFSREALKRKRELETSVDSLPPASIDGTKDPQETDPVTSAMDLSGEALKRKRELETSADSPSPASIDGTKDPQEIKGYNVYRNVGFKSTSILNMPLTPPTTLLGMVGLHSYNSHKGTSLQFKSVTQVRASPVSIMIYYVTLEAIDPDNFSPVTIQAYIWHASPKNHESLRLITLYSCIQGSPYVYSSWNPDGVDLLCRGVMPKWLDDGTEKHLNFNEVKESELQENEWLHLYAQVAAYSEWSKTYNMWSDRKVDYFPLKINKVVVQTMEHVEPSVNKFKSINAIFYLSFKTCAGLNCRGIIRQTMDGTPQHVCLEVVCEIDK